MTITTIFMDDFEKGFVPWDNMIIRNNNGVTLSSFCHHGSQSCQFDWRGESLGVLGRSIFPTKICCTRFLINFASLPAIGDVVYFYEDDVIGGVSDITRLAIYNNAGIYTWRMGYRNPGVLTSDYVPATPITTDTWYTMTAYTRIGNGDGICQMYIDGILRISQTAINNSVSGNTLSNIWVGIMAGAVVPSSPVRFYVDCIHTADELVVPEVVNEPIVYPTIVLETTTTIESTCTRVRTLRHTTALSPWVAS